MDFSLPLSVHGGEKRKSKKSELVEQRGKEAMEGALSMGTHTHTKQQKITRDVLPFARSYQHEALDKAIRENGKPLIAIMLLRSYAHHLRKPSPFIAVFVVPQAVLVSQQAETVRMHTDLKVGVYWKAMGVDFWDAGTWKQEMEKYEVLIMTPVILLNCLRHSFLKLNMIKVLIMDEYHHARGKHPYACIMTEFYHPQLQSGSSALPRIFGMTASPIMSKVGNSESSLSENIQKLMTVMHSKVYTCVSEAVITEFIPTSTPKLKFYNDNGIQIVLFEEITSKLKMIKEQAAESLSSSEFDSFSWGHSRDRVVRKGLSSLWLKLRWLQLLSGPRKKECCKRTHSESGMTLSMLPSSPSRFSLGLNAILQSEWIEVNIPPEIGQPKRIWNFLTRTYQLECKYKIPQFWNCLHQD